MNKEIKLINRIIIGAIYHGGDAGGPYLCDRNEVVPYVNTWLRMRGYDKKYKVSKDEWCVIIPIDKEDDEEYIDDVVGMIYDKVKPDWEESF